MMMKIKKATMMLALGFMVVAPMAVDAQFTTPGEESRQGALRGQTDLTGIINKAIGFILGFIAALSILMIVIGGLMWVVSMGDESKTSTAKNIVLAAITGLIVALLGYAIIYAIGAFVKSS